MQKLYKGLIPLCLLLCVCLGLSYYAMTYGLDRNRDGYHDGDAASVQRMIHSSVWMMARDYGGPADWGFATWDESSPKRIVEMNLDDSGIFGRLYIADLTELRSLSCRDNVIWDISRLPSKLEVLNCEKNILTALDASDANALKELRCGVNLLKKLDVSGLTQLEHLSCDYNQLTDLDVSQSTQLTYLSCDHNYLTELDVSGLINLDILSCAENQITQLDLSAQAKLRTLHCYDNQLQMLQVSHIEKLKNLWCYDNQITELDLGDLKRMSDVNCAYNQLTELNVSNSKGLEFLTCHHNPLQELNLGQIIWMNKLYCYDEGMLIINGDMPISEFDYLARTMELVIQDKFNGCYVEGDAVVNGDKVRFVIDKEQLSDDGVMMVEPFFHYEPEIYKTHRFYQDDHTIVMKETV